MRFEHEGMSLWYGTPDAPAPEGAIQDGSDITITIGVQPTYGSSKVDVLYRINQGPVKTIAAQWLRHDLPRKAYYFRARFPSLHVGDTVEYTAFCHCAGRQVPSPEEAKRLMSSFHVVATAIKPTPGRLSIETPIAGDGTATSSSMGTTSLVGVAPTQLPPSSEPLSVPAPEASRPDGSTSLVTQPPVTMPRTSSMRLNSAMLDKSVLDHLNASTGNKTSMVEMLNAVLKSTLSSALTDSGSTQLAELVQAMSPVNIADNKDVSVRAFVAKQIQGKVQSDAILKKAVDEEVGKLSDKTTIGDLLGLDKPIKDHPLFQNEVQKVALGSLLGTSSAVVSASLLEKFISLYAEHDGPIQDFWSKLREQPDFKAPGTVENIQFTLQLGVLTQNNLPLVQTLQGLRHQGAVKSVCDLTKLDANVWTNLINAPDSAISVPASIPGETQEEKVANYVSGIVDSLHRAFPTAYVAQEVAKHPEIDLKLVKSVLAQNPSLNLRDPLPSNLQMVGISPADQEKAKASLEALRQEARMFPGLDHATLLSANSTSGFQNPMRQAISQFFANAPDFDFRDTHIDTYIAQNEATALAGIDARFKDAIPDQLKRMQRVFQVTPEYETMSRLLGEGLDSAQSIASIPQSTFLTQFQDKLGGQAQASTIYAKAEHIQALTVNTFAHVHSALNDVMPRVIGSNDKVLETIKKIPNWTTLFGSLDLCDCKHCRSVYGPAAYCVDILQFLKKTPAGGGKTLQDILFERRPDLPFIKLNCENAEMPLPYIDLVNEILETYVALDGTGIDGPTLVKDTAADATADELSATPAYTRDDAYDKLKQAIYPFMLPYNRPLEVVRAYLGQLGSSRYELMKTFQVANNPTDEGIGYEYLKISPEEYNILINATLTPPRSLWEFYGYSSSTVSCVNRADGTTSSQSWEKCIAQVPEFLERTGISYLDLIAMLKTRFINPNQFVDINKALTLHVPPDPNRIQPPDPCDLNNTTITNLDDSILLKIYRFIRLWRKLGWQMQDLDRAIKALGAMDIAPPFLQKLSQVKQLQDDLSLPLAQLLSLWANIDTDGDDSLYNKLFQNKAIRNPVDVAFKLNPDGSELATLGATISDHISVILAALRISATDLEVLRTATNLEDHPPTFAPLNLANLSTLYRHTVLAKALKLSVMDLLDLKTLTGKNPFTDSNPALVGSPASTIEFIDEVRKIRESGFTVVQLNYLYRHLYDPHKGIAPLQRNVDLLIKSTQDGLKKIASDNVVMPDPTGDILRSKLAIVLDSSLIDQAKTLIDSSAVYSTPLANKPIVTFPAPLNEKFSYDDTNKKLRFAGNMTQAEETLLLSLSGDPGYQNAITDLFQQPRTFITKNMASFLDSNDAIAHLLDNKPLPKEIQPPRTEEKIAYVLTFLMTYLRISLSQNLVKQKLSESLKLDTAMVDLLLGSVLQVGAPLVLKSHTNASHYAIEDFLALTDGGLSVTYFANKNLDPATGTTVTRIDPTINFNWDAGSPDPTIPGNTFSARWTGKVLAQYNETYTFTTHTNNGVRLWVDNQFLINDWNDQPAVDHSTTIALKAGQFYDVRMEYYNDSTGAVAELNWSSPSTDKVIIPQTQFLPSSVYATYSLLHKVALLVNTFKLTLQEVTYLSDPAHSPDFANFDLNVLPLDRSDHTDDPVVARFNQWDQLSDLVTLRNNFLGSEVSLIDVFEIASASKDMTKLSDATVNALIAVTGWDAKALTVLTGITGFKITDANFKNTAKILVLRASFLLSNRLGVSFDHLFNWTGNEPDAQQAQDVKNTVKAQFDDSQWLTVAKTLNDGLRESQKAALIAYLLQLKQIKDKGISNSSQLYEYFLIDVDMTACMLTSRIVLANSTVQLFLQRCLMNLETEVQGDAITKIDANEWEWMKRYRVWEAARKVFLYPENYLEPELRDDKTPFFKELESELLQKDVTMDTVEEAYLNYLEKLDQVSRLEIVGMYWEEELDPEDERAMAPQDWRILPKLKLPPAVNILYVFGRTFSTPHIYYYRKLINGKLWTPWEKVNVDIEGDHLLPVIHNRRLQIYWPIFTEKADTTIQSQIPKDANSPTEPQKILEIKLAWSEYKHGKWTPKQVSTEFVRSTVLERENHVFKAFTTNDGKLAILDVQAKFSHGDKDQGKAPEVDYAVFRFTGCHGSIMTGEGSFNDTGAGDTPGDDLVAVVPPESSYPDSMTFEESAGHAGLTLITGGFGNVPFLPYTSLKHIETDIPTLMRTTSQYHLLYPPQFFQFVLQAPFFYQDSQRTYFVTPEYGSDVPIQIVRLDNIIPNYNRDFATREVAPGLLNSGDPPIFERVDPTPSGERSVAVVNRMVPSGVPSLESAGADGSRRLMNSSLELLMGTTETVAASSSAFEPAPPTSPTDLLFTTHFHPYVCDFIKKLNLKGIAGLLKLENQEQSDSRLFLPPGVVGVLLPPIFVREYKPTSSVDTPYPAEDVNFTYGDPYSVYNWELFFQIPLFIATRLSKNQQFEEAQKWFHYIFNPTDSSPYPAPQRYWKVLPFRDTPQDRIQDLLRLLDYTGTDQKTLDEKQQVENQVEGWRHNPFDPHLIARMRLIAYQKSVVMKYIDNLIAWGDQLFMQDTMESINEATQLYILAFEILGPRPGEIPARGSTGDKTYNDLQKDLDSFSNTLVNLENQFPFSGGTPLPNPNGSGPSGDLSLGTTFYFCIPQNEQLLGYWDTVADRLFKIRHCMNIEGVVRQLPLFAPPINPALLVQAAAMGIDLNSALNDFNAATPHYRFTYMLQKAMELCTEVKTLGASLLAALEKGDAEHLAFMRASQEVDLLNAVLQVKQQQIEEANANVYALNSTKALTNARYTYYTNLLTNPRTAYENQQINELNQAQTFQEISQVMEILAAGLSLIPNFDLGASGFAASPVVTATFGGSNVASALQSMSRAMSFISSLHSYNANMASILGGWDRRTQEWKIQQEYASIELQQIDQQIAAASIRANIAQLELTNHNLQITNANDIEKFLSIQKYTNEDLYNWMVGRILEVYRQSYDKAFNIAKQAEKAFRFERGLIISDYIKFGYWDNARNGLLAGEQLYLDLKRLEMAYIEQNKRDYEITKQISLVLLDPMALIALKETGICQMTLPEAFFDMDYPGHFMRRIKSISLTIPCVTGPYTSINCTLTLLSSKIRFDSNAQVSYPELDNDPRFMYNFGSVESIATSAAQNDSGMFELNFRDERYLPFEGQGVVSTWVIEMPKDCNAFDFETISDVIIKLNYVARDGGTQLRNLARAAAKLPLLPPQKTGAGQQNAAFPGQDNLQRLFSAKHEFSNEWYRFLHPIDTATSEILNLNLSIERFPFQFRGKTIQISAMNLFLKLKEGFVYDDGKPLTFVLTADDGTALPVSEFKKAGSPINNLAYVEPLNGQSGNLGTWSIEVQESDIKNLDPSLQKTVKVNGKDHVRLNPDAIEDIWIDCQYSVG